jgi:hypothetical protein
LSSGALDPITNPQAWDTVVIGGVQSPGLAILSGSFARGYKYDIKKGKGTLGATSTFVQGPPSKGVITFYLWVPAHFQSWESFRAALKYDPTKKVPTAIDIFHPSLADIDVNSFLTESIGIITHEGKGLFSIKCEFTEYLPPPKTSAVATPKGSSTTSTASIPGAQPDPIAVAQQKEIAGLLQQAAAIP